LAVEESGAGVLGKRFLTKTIKRVGRGLGFDIRRSAQSISNMDAFLAHLRHVGFVPTTVLDVGAHRADWSRLARAYFPHAKFILVEPQLEMRPDLEAFCGEANGSTWKLAGAGPEPGEMTLAVWPDLAGSSLLAGADVGHDLEKRTIPIITIDSLFDGGQELPQLAKLDVQGFELKALQGASKLIGQTECFILEVSLFRIVPDMPVFFEVTAWLDERGYKFYDIAGHIRRPMDNALAQVDAVFVRKGGLLDKQGW
jgi:FkbM family methyltransferase